MNDWQEKEFKKIFIDDGLQNQFLQKGFCKIAFNYPDTTRKLIELFNKYWDNLPSTFAVSHFNPNFDSNKKISNEILDAVSLEFELLLKDFKTIIGHFISKPPNYHQLVELHRDWSYVEESKHLAIQLWIPLQNTDKKNGCLFVVPESQKDLNLRSVTYGIDLKPFESFSDRIIPIEVNIGEAICYHPGLLHGSFTNNTNSSRKAVLISLTHHDAPILYFNKPKSGITPEIEEISPDFFLANHYSIQKEFDEKASA